MHTINTPLIPDHTHDVDVARRFGGVARLYGAGALARFRAAHVCVIGVGGVGSWVVEALARNAIGQLTLIDLDNVAESNINRQIQALSSTLGQAKIGALAEAHNLLSQEKWQGAELREVIARVLQPYLINNPERVRMFGPRVPLTPRLAVVLSMIVHEIATNAAKYGALSDLGGRLSVTWRVEGDEGSRMLHIAWTEENGPPVAPPTREGFGTRLLNKALATQARANVKLDFAPEGFRATIVLPLDG